MNVLDLFSGGAGGWSLGLHRAGFTTVAACEFDPWRRAVYSHNFPGVRVYDDVRTLTATRLADDGIPTIDIIAGSPPCQDASLANTKGKGVDGERTGLFFEALRLVREVRPRWVCLENVLGLRTRGYDRVHDELETAGYAVWPLVVGAWHAGAPHKRNRVWIVAADADFVRELQSQGGIGDKREWAGDICDEWVPADPMHAIAEGRRDQTEGWNGGTEEMAGIGPTANPSQSGLSCEQLEPRICEPEYTTDRCAFLETWQGWNKGFAGFGRVDDGLPKRVARECISAYGDSVLPQITEAIGRTVMRLDSSAGEW